MKTKLIKPTNEYTKINVTEDTQFVLDVSAGENCTLEFIFETQNVNAAIIAIYKLEKDQKINLTTVVNHVAPNTSCETKVRGALFDNANAKYIGKILIAKMATNTNSFLNHNTLVVGENTKNESQPVLKIDNNNVKASHASTTNRIQQPELYYLLSRGIAKNEAQQLILNGFLGNLAAKIHDNDAQNYLRKKLLTSDY
jgi:Fe-S cluster assembly scaffold protein SufB